MSESKKSTVSKTDAGANKSKNNKNLILMIVTLVSVVVIAIATTVLVMAAINSGKEPTDNNSSSNQTASSSDNEKEETPVETKTETLTLSGLSMEYTSPTWKKDSTAGSDAAAVYKGKDYYMMLAHTKAAQKMTSKEFAEASIDSYEDMGFKVVEGLKAQTINGTEWQRVKLFGEKAWTTVLFLANGTDYYIVTFASTTTAATTPEDAEAMIQSLTVKK